MVFVAFFYVKIHELHEKIPNIRVNQFGLLALFFNPTLGVVFGAI